MKEWHLAKRQGIILVRISANTFQNNKVKLMAMLWGEKNNVQFDNTFLNSETMDNEKYLKQKLMY